MAGLKAQGAPKPAPFYESLIRKYSSNTVIKLPMLIRNFAPTDLGEVMRLVAETFRQDYSPSMYLSLHAHWAEGFLVASENGKVVGLLLGSSHAPGEARILIMTSDKENRKKGIGTALLNTFEERCGIRGIIRIILEVRSSNIRAQTFYSKRGFQKDSVLPRYYLDGEDSEKLIKWL